MQHYNKAKNPKLKAPKRKIPKTKIPGYDYGGYAAGYDPDYGVGYDPGYAVGYHSSGSGYASESFATGYAGYAGGYYPGYAVGYHPAFGYYPVGPGLTSDSGALGALELDYRASKKNSDLLKKSSKDEEKEISNINIKELPHYIRQAVSYESKVPEQRNSEHWGEVPSTFEKIMETPHHLPEEKYQIESRKEQSKEKNAPEGLSAKVYSSEQIERYFRNSKNFFSKQQEQSALQLFAQSKQLPYKIFQLPYKMRSRNYPAQSIEPDKKLYLFQIKPNQSRRRAVLPGKSWPVLHPFVLKQKLGLRKAVLSLQSHGGFHPFLIQNQGQAKRKSVLSPQPEKRFYPFQVQNVWDKRQAAFPAESWQGFSPKKQAFGKGEPTLSAEQKKGFYPFRVQLTHEQNKTEHPEKFSQELYPFPEKQAQKEKKVDLSTPRRTEFQQHPRMRDLELKKNAWPAVDPASPSQGVRDFPENRVWELNAHAMQPLVWSYPNYPGRQMVFRSF